MITIKESEMTFGPFHEDQCFPIENSLVHTAAGEGIKIVEFVKLTTREGHAPQLWFVEAKKSSPRVDPLFDEFVERMKKEGYSRFRGKESEVDDFIDFARNERLSAFGSPTNDFEDYFSDIREKMENSLALYFSSILERRHGSKEAWPEPFRSLDLAALDIRFFLVIKKADDSWLPPLNEKLKSVLKPLRGSWAIGPNSAAVLTEARAQQHGLIAAS